MKTNTLVVNLEDLPKNSKTPILTYCRKLIKDGVDYNSKLHVFRGNQPDPDVIVNNIGDAAKLGVSETLRVGPVFVKYSEWGMGSQTDKNNKLEVPV